MADVFGVRNNDAVIKLAVSATKQINRFIVSLLVVMNTAAGWPGRGGFYLHVTGVSKLPAPA